MKTKKINLRSIAFLVLAFMVLNLINSCGSKRDEQRPGSFDSYSEKSAVQMEEEKGKMDDSQSALDSIVTNQEAISSSAAVVSKDTNRKFIRTADVKFRVKDVRYSTLKIEDIVGEHDGFVTFTELRSDPQYVDLKPYSEDSSIEVIRYIVNNHMTVRVPNVELDSTLRAIGRLAEFLDYRIIKADDVSLSLKSNQLALKRLKKYDQNVTNAINNKENRLKDISQAEENKLNRQEQADNRLIEDLGMKDQIDYSTIEINLYQRMTIMKTIVEREKEIVAYKPQLR